MAHRMLVPSLLGFIVLWYLYSTVDVGMLMFYLGSERMVTERFMDDQHRRRFFNKDLKVVFACITRDDDYGLAVNKLQIEELGKRFGDYRVILVENDSHKGFYEELQAWAKSNPKVKVINKVYNLTKRPTLSFLAKMRNLYLEEFKRADYDDFEKLVVFDMDLSHRWPAKKIVLAMSEPDSRIGSRCVHVYNRDGGHRDALALRDYIFMPYEFKKRPASLSKDTLARIYRITAEWFARDEIRDVQSCFGGMAIYPRRAILPCSYNEKEEDCEHVSLTRCIRKLHMRVVVDTRLAIPFHERTVSDGLLVKMFSTVHILLLACIPGAIRKYFLVTDCSSAEGVAFLTLLSELCFGGVCSLILFVVVSIAFNMYEGVTPLIALFTATLLEVFVAHALRGTSRLSRARSRLSSR